MQIREIKNYVLFFRLNFLVDTLLDPLREAYGERIVDILKTGGLPFDQLILYDTTG